MAAVRHAVAIAVAIEAIWNGVPVQVGPTLV